MTKFRFFTTAAWGSLTGALLLAALPANAQDQDRGRQWGREARAEQRAERQNQGGGNRSEQREARTVQRSDNGGDRAAWAARRNGSQGFGRDRSSEVAAAQAQAGVQTQAARNTSYTGQRDGSYGANTRRDWAAQRDAAARQQNSSGSWARSGDRNESANRSSWGNRSETSRRNDWQRNRSDDNRRSDWQRERRDDARNYANGYRDGRRDDNRWDNRNTSRYGQDYRRWDNRSWRNDNRYDWYRYRASNRSLFSLGRYYAPYRGYSYSRISIGFRLGSPFYANRYWINDPWQYRLPAVYGPYRWIRYYDDALLVDIYSGEVVDVINNFFW